MRINAIVEPMKYNEQTRSNNTIERNKKQDNKSENISFSEVLKQVHSTMTQNTRK